MSLVQQKKVVFAVVGVLVLLVLSVLMYVYSSATPREPEDFGGVKWGSGISRVQGMKLLAESGDLKFYEKENSPVKLGDAKLERTVYGFYKDRFYSVMVYFNSQDNFDKLKKAFSSWYGEPTQPEPNAAKFFWNGESVNLLLMYDNASQSGRVSYFFKPLQIEAEMSQK